MARKDFKTSHDLHNDDNDSNDDDDNDHESKIVFMLETPTNT